MKYSTQRDHLSIKYMNDHDYEFCFKLSYDIFYEKEKSEGRNIKMSH